MNGKKWVGLDEPIGDCQCCIHQEECAPLKQHIQKKGINGHYRFRCPILIEVDEDVYGGLSKAKKGKGEEKKMKAKNKSCKTCKNRDGPSFDRPCLGCSARLNFNHWEEDPEL